MYLLLAFIVVPILEIAVFIQVGGLIGLWPTIALVLLTAIAGTLLLRTQGFAVLRRAQASLARNELPVREVFDGLCLAAAGALLLTPGFVTDTIGLLLFVPAVRNRLRGLALKLVTRGEGMRVFVDGAEVHPHGGRPNGPFHRGPSHGRGPGGPGGADVIEGEFREVRNDDRDPDGAEDDLPPPDSRWRPPGGSGRP